MSENQPERSESSEHLHPSDNSEFPEAESCGLPAELAGDEDAALLAELLPPEKRHMLSVVASRHQGWLPPPNMLAEYEHIVPGLAERIVAMPEREQRHRHEFVAAETKRQYRIRRRGQDYAMISVALVLSFAVFLALMGEIAWAAKLVIATLVGVVGIFVTGKWLDVRAEAEGSKSEG